MGLCTVQKDTIIRLDGAEYKLLHKVTDTTWLLENSRSHRVVELEHEQILRKIANGTFTFPCSEIAERRRPTLMIDGQNFEAGKVRRAYVLAVLKVPNTGPAMQETAKHVWEQLKTPLQPPSLSTIYRWKSLYLKSGQDINSLIDNTRAKGNRIGRYSSEVCEICRQAIHTKYLVRERNTMQETLEHAMHLVDKENQLRPAEFFLKMPTPRLIKRLIQAIPAYDAYAARFGPDAARREFRSVMGHTLSDRPLERAEIDHSILDLMVLDDDTCLPLGRPYITICIDHYSRCVLGVFVAFTPPSYMSVAECLKDCFRPKVWLKDVYPEIKNEWAAFGVMTELVLDNGLEFHSDSLEQACHSLGIEMHYAPRRQGWFKGTIERFIGTMNRGVAHGKPGTSFANFLDKGDYDPAKHAVITLSTLKAIVHKWIVDIYHQQTHSSIQTTPADKWMSSIRLEEIHLPDESTNFDIVMGRVGERVLTHKGIEHEGLLYNSEELTDLRHRQGSKLKVSIRTNDADLGSIYVLCPPSFISHSVPALRQDYAKGLSLWQHKVIKRWQAKSPNFGTGPDGWLQAKEDIARLIEDDFELKRRKTRKHVARFKEDTKRNQDALTTCADDSERIVCMPTVLTQSTSSIQTPACTTVAAHVTDTCSVDDSYPTFDAIYKESLPNG